MPSHYYPLELNLSDQPVLMVGGGNIAGRKLPELLACGAKITVIAPRLSPVTRRLLPGLRWQEREFHPEDVQGRRLVFACTDSAAVNSAVSEACLAHGIPCNRSDDSQQGDFIVPGVVRRGNVTVSVSTGGRAPALTRHLKRKLAAVLGEEWGLLAELAAAARPDVLNPPPFETLAKTLRTKGMDAARALLAPSPTKKNRAGKIVIHPVVLVGAGPGDPSLLTLAAAEALRNAEVVIHDRLVHAGVLATIRKSCVCIPAEKRGHFESQRQEHINARLVEQARAGKRVVRLKGGDPFVFGRGYEEALALEAAGLSWRVIPGVSSALAVPALAGIPLTHRGVARSFAVTSGMSDGDTHLDFPKVDTLVLLMALYRLEEIVPALLRNGYAAEMPAAAIQSGTLPDQRVCRSTLGRIREDTARLGFDSPALLVIGKVVALSHPPHS